MRHILRAFKDYAAKKRKHGSFKLTNGGLALSTSSEKGLRV